ncbi:MAG: FkbM family methyltransferase [Cytophaga sp.]|nr:FkbM family methyltransferase [Undibacterium sp.]
MINYSHPVFVLVRSLGQKLGILRPAVRVVRWLFSAPYENKFDSEMLSLISSGDVVWDVGANVGFFTTKFADKVGVTGIVYAFEPSVRTYATLESNCSKYLNVICKNLGLSERSGSLSFRETGVENDPTNGLVDEGTPGSVRVLVASGDELVKDKSFSVPNAIKIDVEGFEVEVIKGMREVINNIALKKIFVEVHFLEMSKRGLKNGSTEIVQIIQESGFTLKWTDPSHFIAVRKE